METKEGQVAGAFYREDLGDIGLVWGKAGSAKSDGYGLAKITKYHPEVLDKLDDLIQTLPIVKESPNRYQLENANYKASIRKDSEGVKGNWVLTAFEKKESIARRSTDLPSTQWEAKKTTLANAGSSPTSTPLKSQDFKAKATELYNTAKAQEGEFKEFLENLKSANNSLELGQILKSESSIESKIARKQEDISATGDYLRAAIISKDKTQLDTELVKLVDSLESRGIKPTIELQHRETGYKGVR
nr:hypothetical protein [Helicobacter suis]